jgi:hypothetical protein
MKPFLLGTVVGIAFTGAALQIQNLASLVYEIYPIDPAKRQALAMCALADPNFNRLRPIARDACYRHELTATVTAARATISLAPNPVALQEALAWEGAPGNDVRIVQASQQFSSNLADDPRRQ